MSRFTPDTLVNELSGVGKTRAEKLAKLGVNTLRDLVYYMPRAYENRGNVRELSKYDTSTYCSFILTVATEVRSANIKRGFNISKFRAFDQSGSIEIVFFNAPYIKDVFHVGSEFRFWAKPVFSKNKLQLVNPKYEPIIEGSDLPDFVPIYPQTEGMSSKQIDALIKCAINDVLPQIIDPLPENIRLKCELPTISRALFNAHFPSSQADLAKAMERLAFDEMLCFGIGISLSAKRKNLKNGIKFSPCSLEPLLSRLPYELTPTQKSAVNDIYKDTVIGDGNALPPMARIIVGDVGCGKTVCAIIAIYISASSGYQSAMMVPTEILARQHYEDISRLFGDLGIKVELLLGSTTQKEKKRIYADISSGEATVIIGTHALLSDKVYFAKLGLVITDEQHRFGVGQRAVLREKDEQAHMLVMSATPIPRTLALTMYGDLDISRITDMPKGRQRVDTFVVNESYRKRLNDFISKQVALGGQCYIVCPAIEQAEEDDDSSIIYDAQEAAFIPTNSLSIKNAVDHTKRLKEDLPHLKIGLLHGKMKAAEKDAVMADFSSGKLSVIVSTTVIEVGVNVPSATLIIIENAERFGLSQLHQLRGRVGRGSKKSYCVLVSDMEAEKSKARLEIMRSTYSGFEIAEKDLMLRGPGDFFSSNEANNLRQSGGFEFKFATNCDNVELFNSAFAIAKDIINSDPDLEHQDHQYLKNEVRRFITNASSTIS